LRFFIKRRTYKRERERERFSADKFLHKRYTKETTYKKEELVLPNEEDGK
jgi:hypothetical protein